MIEFRPFRGVHPTEEVVQDFVTKAVNTYTKEEIDSILRDNKNSFLNVISPTWTENEDTSEERLRKVRQKYEQLIEENVLVQDNSSFYIYQILMPDGARSRGLLGLIHNKSYAENKIKKHEEIFTDKIELFSKYLEGVHFHAEPVLLTYPANQRVGLLMDVEINRRAILTIKEGEIEHSIWRVEDRLNLRQFKSSIEKMENLYIADGHHRMESSLAYTAFAEKNYEEEIHGDEAFNYVLAMLVSDEELIIHDYNRLLKDLNGLSTEAFLAELDTYFEVVVRGEIAFFPSKKHHIVMYLEGVFYGLFVKRDICKTVAGLSELDTYIFEECLLKPILNIQDISSDERVAFIPGTSSLDGVNQIKEKVDSGEFKVGFVFYPIVATDLEMIANLGLTMPPKSTYIQPKPLSGFTIYDLKE